MPRTCADSPAVIDCYRNTLCSQIITSCATTSILGLSSTETVNGRSAVRSVDDELINVFRTVNPSQITKNWDREPMDLYKNPNEDIGVSKSEALDVLRVPVGEASSEYLNIHIFNHWQLDCLDMSAEIRMLRSQKWNMSRFR